MFDGVSGIRKISKPPLGTDTNNELVKKNVDDQRSVPELLETKALATEEVDVKVEEEQGRDNGNWAAVVDGINGLQITEHEFFDIEEEEDEEEGIGLLSAEELNKKCDDFIKMMKEGIKIEAQQLITV
ncbi:hypothetical protein F0562_008179 [Nyssa sinensis]|uniref:Uncharacterized protein n=1 Tax=Nyssa sinensis TaxID=561372 RepID=A0A5J5A9B4_9ASTE|nr:hypothetical protein F0562_008179 [Nyssa sinensis]